MAGVAFPEFSDQRWNLREFGSVGDGVANDSAALSTAIKTCSESGGGTVIIPPGRYAVASVRLLSGVRIELDPQAEIFGAPRGAFPIEREFPTDVFQDMGMSYPELSVLWSDGAENIAIVGGRINGGSVTRHDPEPGDGNKVIAIFNSKKILLDGVTHEQGGHFVYNINGCEDVVLRDVVIGVPRGSSSVQPDGNMLLRNRDAISLISCRRVRVVNAHFTGSGDDAIGIKNNSATGREGICEDIRVWDSYIESGCNALQFGSETAGDFRNIHFWNITIYRAMKAALSVTSNDGGNIEDISFHNIRIQGAATPIFMAITDRLRTHVPGKQVGSIRGVKFSDIEVSGSRSGWHGHPHPVTLLGHPDSWIENVVFENLGVTYTGGSPHSNPDYVMAYTHRYSPDRVGDRPSSALYAREVRNIIFREASFAWEQPDPRIPFVFLKADAVRFDSVRLEKNGPSGGFESVFKLDAVTGLTVSGGNLPQPPTSDFPALPTPYIWRNSLAEPVIPAEGQPFDLVVSEKRYPIVMLWVPPGSFRQGSPENEKYRDADETLRTVNLTKGFWLSAHEITQRQWFSIMGSNPSRFHDDPELPVHNVSWCDAMEYCRKLTLREAAAGRLPAGNIFTLPTEAQWEYACRAGSDGKFGGSGDMHKMGWFDHNLIQRPIGASPMQIGMKQPNAWGFYDMHGNVYEWCRDTYAPYLPGPINDPLIEAKGHPRVIRGGSWRHSDIVARSANRAKMMESNTTHYMGFRIATAHECGWTPATLSVI